MTWKDKSAIHYPNFPIRAFLRTEYEILRAVYKNISILNNSHLRYQFETLFRGKGTKFVNLPIPTQEKNMS